MAKIYLKGGTEKTLINAVREAYYQPFVATEWTDLRIGFFLSVCDNADPAGDDLVAEAGMVETIGTEPHPILAWTDRVSIGVTDSRTGSIFLGYTNVVNSDRGPGTIGSSKLLTSDNGIGTTNDYFWRWKNEESDTAALKIIDAGSIRAHGITGSQMHLPRVPASAGGYSTCVALRLQRDDTKGRAKIITMTVKQGTNNGDILYSNDPSETNLIAQLQAFPDTVQQLGPVELSQVPDTIWCYWPFSGSRLRVHSYGILRAA